MASNLDVCLGQVKTDQKSDEITAIPSLLEMLKLKGCIVSINAMGTQKEIAKKIIEKEGDYFLALKGNQKTLFEQVKHQFFVEAPDSYFEKNDFSGSHNAVTTYQVSVYQQLKWIENAADWKDLSSIVCVQTSSDKRDKELRYYISSVKNLQAEQAYNLAREHWSVENKLHWHPVPLRDVVPSNADQLVHF